MHLRHPAWRSKMEKNPEGVEVERRYVKYSGDPDPTQLPAEWHQVESRLPASECLSGHSPQLASAPTLPHPAPGPAPLPHAVAAPVAAGPAHS